MSRSKITSKPYTEAGEASWDRVFGRHTEFHEEFDRNVQYCVQCGRRIEFHDHDDLCFICRSKAEDAHSIQREIEEFE